jgi:hypothetical protein
MLYKIKNRNGTSALIDVDQIWNHPDGRKRLLCWRSLDRRQETPITQHPYWTLNEEVVERRYILLVDFFAEIWQIS